MPAATRDNSGWRRDSEETADDVDARGVFPRDGADAHQEEIEERARHPVLPPTGPVGDVVAQALEIQHARLAYPGLGHGADGAGRDAWTEGFQRARDEG